MYRVFHSGVDWHITYNISETHVCIKTKFCTCVHELFTSNFWFNNFFLRPLTLAVLIRYYVYFDDFLKAFYVFFEIFSVLKFSAHFSDFLSVNALKASLKQAWSEITPEVIIRSFAQFPDRLEKLILNNGGHFE